MTPHHTPSSCLGDGASRRLQPHAFRAHRPTVTLAVESYHYLSMLWGGFPGATSVTLVVLC